VTEAVFLVSQILIQECDTRMLSRAITGTAYESLVFSLTAFMLFLQGYLLEGKE